MFQRILIILALLLIVPDIYIYRMFVARPEVSTWLKIAYWIPSLVLIAIPAYISFLSDGKFMSEHPRFIGWFMIVVFLFALSKLLFMICSLVGLPFNYLLQWPRTPFTVAGLIGVALVAGVILYGAFVGKTCFDVKEVTYQSTRVPIGFDGYRIVQLSDIHIGSWEGNAAALQRMVNKVNALKPDLIVFTGDLVNHRADELNGFQEILAQLHARDGVYSILGNHDYGPYFHWDNPREQVENLINLKKREADMGWMMLNNAHTILHQAGDSIALVGVENEGEPPFSQHGDLPKALQGTEGMFQLLLSHNPTHWRREVLPTSQVDLMLAGHTHGMQLAFGKYSPASFVYKEWGGMYTENRRSLYVNVGLGFVGLPFRFGAWPEITIITLKH